MVGVGVDPDIGLCKCTCDAHFPKRCPGFVRWQKKLRLQCVELARLYRSNRWGAGHDRVLQIRSWTAIIITMIGVLVMLCSSAGGCAPQTPREDTLITVNSQVFEGTDHGMSNVLRASSFVLFHVKFSTMFTVNIRHFITSGPWPNLTKPYNLVLSPAASSIFPFTTTEFCLT